MQSYFFTTCYAQTTVENTQKKFHVYQRLSGQLTTLVTNLRTISIIKSRVEKRKTSSSADQFGDSNKQKKAAERGLYFFYLSLHFSKVVFSPTHLMVL